MACVTLCDSGGSSPAPVTAGQKERATTLHRKFDLWCKLTKQRNSRLVHLVSIDVSVCTHACAMW